MSEFKNRVGLNLNRKKYIIEEDSVERNECGEIISFIAEEVRYDNPYINGEGTPLNAESLNEIIQDMIHTNIQRALENYHENGLAELENAETTVLVDGSCAMSNYIYINVPEAVTITIENEYEDYFEVTAPNSAPAGTITVNITCFQAPDFTGVTELNFIVKLYSQLTNEMIKKVTCSVTFQVPSVTPED